MGLERRKEETTTAARRATLKVKWMMPRNQVRGASCYDLRVANEKEERPMHCPQ